GGFEALMRWKHPQRGLLMPAAFIPLAELSDVIRPLTLAALRVSLRQQRAWEAAGRRLRVAVNLSARHLLDDGCPEQVETVLGEEKTDPERLELEITESALIGDPERATAHLERIPAL